MQRQKMEFRDYIEALEQERLKIQVFSKELPLSLELVTQAIEACKQQLSGTTTEYNFHGQSECSEQTTSMEEGPVLEEFIPIKKRASPESCNDVIEDDEEQSSHMPKILKENHSNNDNNKNSDKRKSDWLRSVQLWNPEPSPKEDVPRKASVVEVKRNGGAFQPFHREESAGKTNNNNASSACKSPVPATSSTAGAVAGGGVSVAEKKSEEKDAQGQRKQRRCWSPELHKRFLQALQQLGGADSATPKQIRELMKVDGLTNDEVKSHLQKFRLHTRRPSPIMHNNANPQTAPFVLVGNIFVQPPEYAAASGEVTTVTAPGGIYAPVAAHPPAAPFAKKSSVHLELKQLEQNEQHHSHSEEEERVNHSSEGAVHSNSPAASSSSTHTTSTSGY
ncbi:transcription factor HHO3-like [Senna tora]|uniref:Transcription factor HHO3-like n=1 Tax=Senna tora TaxID=362788 RepID=A0A834TSX1_9FABA|nr:transcription factor HHO3-like [Senna tora]